jgi:hypothetical protein
MTLCVPVGVDRLWNKDQQLQSESSAELARQGSAETGQVTSAAHGEGELQGSTGESDQSSPLLSIWLRCRSERLAATPPGPTHRPVPHTAQWTVCLVALLSDAVQ